MATHRCRACRSFLVKGTDAAFRDRVGSTYCVQTPSGTGPHDPVPALKGLRATVLCSPYGRGVLAGTYDQVIVTGAGIPEQHPESDRAPAVELRDRTGRVAAWPVERAPGVWAASGAYVVHSGCRAEWLEVFGHDLPIPLHDYYETDEQYREMV